MAGLLYSDERLREMYAGGRADATARRFSRFWAAAFRLGLLPRRWVTLEVTGRVSGQPVQFPLGMASLEGDWYLVSMLGEDCNWVRNVRAAGGQATLRRRSAMPCRLVEVPVAERAPILKRYLEQVPGARPHIPVDRGGPVAAFEAVAPRYPVFRVVEAAPAPRPRRHRRRWLVAAGLVALIGLGSALLLVKPTPVMRPLTLPASRGAAVQPAGSIDGTWQVSSGSVAGFRVPEHFFGMSDDVVGRTTAVSGTVSIVRDEVTGATFRVDLSGVEVNGKTQPQFVRSLGVAANPDATFNLTEPLTFSQGPESGGVVMARATGAMTLHGVSRTVSLAISGRSTGATLLAVGTIPVAFSDYGIVGPQGYAPIGSLADHGVVEFLIVMRRA
jgi:polyisoprenoid-binding protein YceI